MTYTVPQRPVVNYTFNSVARDIRQPQWWMKSQRSSGLMMSDSGFGSKDSQSGDF